MKYSRIIIIASFFVSISCQNTKEKISKLNPKKEVIKNAEKFNEFNAHFHSDSLFQISRINFPIEGISVSGFDKHNWTKENWIYLTVPVSEQKEIGDYQHSLMKTDSLVIEKFWIPDSGFEVERQFKLIKNKWFLVYYNDINL